ncbi:MAG: tRNA (adenosine(37)-N6)-threonylcarbamoyltransferase complex ATPase subunit type 1 TsaE [Pseudomonadota bacterium]
MIPFLTQLAHTPDDTLALGQRLGHLLAPGDVVFLSAPLGVGKTVFARGVVETVMGDGPQEVPSPTFTLVQPYDGRIPLWHADLYRLEAPGAVVELGFDDALDVGALLVEWPEHGEGYLPDGALWVRGEISSASQNARLWQLSGTRDWHRRFVEGQ